MLKHIIAPLIFGSVGIVILVSLGVWQVHRLGWKDEILSGMAERMNGPSLHLTRDVEEKNDEYSKFFVEGKFLSKEVHILTSEKFVGPGFRVIMPFLTKSGLLILVDRGFILEKFKDINKESESNFVEGNLLWPDEIDYFTPRPNIEKNIWFARDLEGISKYLKTEPILLVAIAENKPNDFIEPKPISIDIPNNHFQYAVTWFSLSIIWFFMTIYFFCSRFSKN